MNGSCDVLRVSLLGFQTTQEFLQVKVMLEFYICTPMTFIKKIEHVVMFKANHHAYMLM